MSELDSTKPGPISDPLTVTSSRRLGLGGAVGSAAALGLLALSHAPLLRAFELRTLDWRQRVLATSNAAVDQVPIVLVDGSSVEIGQRGNSVRFPWPRDMYVPLLTVLGDAGIKAVTFDMILCDPRPAETDGDFAAVAHDTGNVTAALELDGLPQETDVEAKGLKKASVDMRGWTFAPRKGLARLVRPLPEIVHAVRGLGFVNFIADPAGTIRRLDVATTYPDRGKEVSSLPLDVARTILGRDPSLPFEERNNLLGDRRIPGAGTYSALVFLGRVLDLFGASRPSRRSGGPEPGRRTPSTPPSSAPRFTGFTVGLRRRPRRQHGLRQRHQDHHRPPLRSSHFEKPLRVRRSGCDPSSGREQA